MPMKMFLDKVAIWISRLDMVDWFQYVASKKKVKTEPNRTVGQGNRLNTEELQWKDIWRNSQEYLIEL